MAEKTGPGNFFEDFHVGQNIVHATPRTVTEGEVALYTALYGSRFAVNSSSEFAVSIGFSRAPVDDLLTFHLVFGKTVPDISLNAIANLGYASGIFGAPLYPGDTISASSTVIGLKQNTDGKTGVVYVRSEGVNQRGEMVIDYCRWVMVRKKDLAATAPEAVIPELPESVPAGKLIVPEDLDLTGYCAPLAGSVHLWDDYQVGEKINHLDGVTIEEAEHMLATRLYQNTARVHFNSMRKSRGPSGAGLSMGDTLVSCPVVR
jgi:2-methylfumaryl-CoA hydratase